MSDRDLDAGRDAAIQLIPLLKTLESHADDVAHLYAGLLLGLTGVCIGAIGPHATEILVEAAESIAQELLRKSKQ